MDVNFWRGTSNSGVILSFQRRIINYSLNLHGRIRLQRLCNWCHTVDFSFGLTKVSSDSQCYIPLCVSKSAFTHKTSILTAVNMKYIVFLFKTKLQSMYNVVQLKCFYDARLNQYLKPGGLQSIYSSSLFKMSTTYDQLPFWINQCYFQYKSALVYLQCITHNNGYYVSAPLLQVHAWHILFHLLSE